MKAIKAVVASQEETLVCFHWRVFPPRLAKVKDPRSMKKKVTSHEWSQYETFTRVCGLSEMTPSKCLSCPLCRKVVKTPFKVKEEDLKMCKLDGTGVTPVRV